MKSDIVRVCVFLAALAMVYYLSQNPIVVPFGPPLAELVATETVGADASSIGRLTKPVTAEVMIHPANASEPHLAIATIVPGTWLTSDMVITGPKGEGAK